MPLDRCIFAVRLNNGSEERLIEERIDRLARFYRPLGDPVVEVRRAPALQLWYGCVGFGRAEADDVLTWGGSLPLALRTPNRLVSASDGELRSIEGAVGAIAVDGDRARIVTGVGGVTSLYAAGSDLADAWASHAVAAAWLATGAARIEPLAIAELLALGYVGDERALVAEARAVPLATRVDIDRAGASTAVCSPVRP